MSAFLLVKLAAALVAAFLAVGVYVRDPGVPMLRQMALVVAAAGWWALCEFVWNQQTDPELAIVVIRLSGIGWLSFGVLVLHAFRELAPARSRGLDRGLRRAYFALAAGIALYVGTPWCTVAAVPAPWGWSYEFGPLFPVAYAATAAPIAVILFNWRAVYPSRGSQGERRVALAVILSIGFGLVVASVTDVLAVYADLGVRPWGSVAVVAACAFIGIFVRRYGYSMLSTGASSHDILDTLREGVMVVSTGGRVRDGNRALLEMLGMAPPELADRPLADLLPGLPARLEVMRAAAETELVDAAGERVPVHVSAPIRCTAGGRVLAWALLVRDRRDVQSLRQRLATAARLAAVGDLSAAIAAAITTPILRVGGNLSELRLHWRILSVAAEQTDARDDLESLMTEGEEIIDECMEGADRVGAIVREVRGFARTRPAVRELCEVDGMVRNALRLARPAAGEGIVIEHVPGRHPRVSCAPQEIEQVLINLIVNAFQACGTTGRVEIRSESGEGRVKIHLTDDGCGMSTELLDRIFDPFFTTKPVGKGTGLGLAISYHIVRNHDGELHVRSEPGQGTTFTLDLPAAES